MAVVGTGAVFAVMVLVENVRRDGSEGRIELQTAEGHVSTHFEGDAVVQGIDRTGAPGEWRMVELQHAGNMERIDLLVAEGLDNGMAGVALVIFSGFLRGQGTA